MKCLPMEEDCLVSFMGRTLVQVPILIENSLHNLHHRSHNEIHKLHKTGVSNITKMLFFPIAKFYLFIFFKTSIIHH